MPNDVKVEITAIIIEYFAIAVSITFPRNRLVLHVSNLLKVVQLVDSELKKLFPKIFNNVLSRIRFIRY